MIHSEQNREKLLRLARGRNTAQKVVLRAKIVLKMMEGVKKKHIAEQLGTSRPTVNLWIQRYEEGGTEALLRDASRPGRKPKRSEGKEKVIVDATLHSKPANATHWSVRLMAEAQGVSRMAVHRIWRKYNLKPHLIRTFKISNDPSFVEKVKDIVGLYLNPPDKAMVLCIDEKSQIQALDRTQPGLPMKKGRAGTMTHDYKRHGTTTLFAALNILNGKVIGECMPRHRQDEFLKFLKKIDKETPKKLDLHLIADNYGSHKTEKVKMWLKKHPRFKMHFTPTSSSWINMVERFFSELTNKRVRRGVFRSVKELEMAVMDFVNKHNDNPKVFTWTKDANTILSKVNTCKEVLGTVH
ncbi:MAG: IS630 family transposase [Deltaproteobacteria bacterium]|nr:IS630 family transposase [Deltaproteobacteria bacterium]